MSRGAAEADSKALSIDDTIDNSWLVKRLEESDSIDSNHENSSSDGGQESTESKKRQIVMRKVHVPKIKLHSPSVDTGNTILEDKVVMVPKKLARNEQPLPDDKLV